MENFDTLSNCSDNSISIKSNASTVSGLSCYQNEFAELQHLVHPEKYPETSFDRSLTPKLDEGYVSYDQNLTDALQKCQLVSEKYKLQLDNLEKKIELKYCDKIEKLLRNNTRLEAQLDNANIQINRLINSHNKNIRNDLERRYHDLLSQNSLLQKEYCELKDVNYKYELENKDLKVALNDTIIDNHANNSCIESLKEKISFQHVEIQNLLKNHSIVASNLDEIKNELEHVSKSKDWYKEQFHECQIEKQNLSKSILDYKHTVSVQNDRIELLNIALKKQENKCDEFKLNALREKEKLLKKLEICDVASERDIIQPILNNEVIGNNQPLLEFNLYTEGLTEEIHQLKSDLQESKTNFEKASKENSELVAKYLMLQKNLQQGEAIIEVLECEKKHLVKKVEAVCSSEKQKSDEVLQLKNKKSSLEIELSSYHHEKEMVDNSIKLIRNQFLKFKHCYEKLKDDLQDKNKQILLLQSEKQELFMKNNWTICELEKTKEKDIVIKKLRTDIEFYDTEVKKLLKNLKSLETEVSKKEQCVKETQEQCKKYEAVVLQYRSLTEEHEVKMKQLHTINKENCHIINNLKETIKALTIETNNKATSLLEFQEKIHRSEENLKIVKDLKENVTTLTFESNKKDISLQEFQEKIRGLENECEKLREEKKLLKKLNEQPLKTLSNQKNIAHVLSFSSETPKMENGLLNVHENYVLPNSIAKVLSNGSTFSSKLSTVLHDKFLINNIVSSIFKFEESFGLQLSIIHKNINGLSSRSEDCYKKLSKLLENRVENSNSEDFFKKLKELRVMLQVRDLELKEKQKKCEINNRTLLRKVKEHMRGRNTAEKHNKYLQELYNTISYENNTLKLDIGSKTYEIEELNKLVENYKNINAKLKETVLNLEKEIVGRSSVCEKCLQLEELQEKYVSLQGFLKEVGDKERSLQENLMDTATYANLMREMQTLRLNNIDFAQEINKKDKEIITFKENLCTLQSEIIKKKTVIDRLCEEIEKEQAKCRQITAEKVYCSEKLEQKNIEIEQQKNKLEILSLELQHKTEEIKRLEDSKRLLADTYSGKETEVEKTISELKHHLETTQSDVTALESEKHFLQRLCKDLKVALRTHISQNKVLRDQLRNLDKEKLNNFNSLPNTLLPDLPTSSQYDEAFINSLLEEHKNPKNKPVATEIQNHLNSLRKEILMLQEEIVKKNAKR